MSQKSLTILLADDDPDDQMLIADAFTAIDTTLYLNVVGDGHAVLHYLKALPSEQFPCLIVLDYNMPGLSGLEVLQELKRESRYQHIPKVILSTTDNPHFVKECLTHGADKYLIKPVNYQSLVGIARELMEWCTAGIHAKS